MRRLTDHELARIIHQAHIAYNVILHDNAPDGPWDTLTQEHKDQIARRAERIRECMRYGMDDWRICEVIHWDWVVEMLADDWTPGDIKDPVKKTHTCLRPLRELPEEMQRKDLLAVNVARTFVSPADEITRLGEEMGLPEVGVCVTHQRFLPCRKDDGTCILSEDQVDVDQVYRHQRGYGRA